MKSWLQRLARPSVEASDPIDRLRAELMATHIFVGTIVGCLVVTGLYVLQPDFGSRLTVVVPALAMLMAAFLLSRTRHWPIAGVIAAIVAIGASVAVGAMVPDDQIWPAATSFGVVFASVYLSVRKMIMVAVLSVLASTVMIALHPAYHSLDLAMPPLAVQLLLFPLFIFAAQFRDRLERERRDLLRHSEQMLSEAQRLASLGNWSIDLVTGEALLSDECKRLLGCRSLPETGVDGLLTIITENSRGAFERSTVKAMEARGESFSADIETQSGDAPIRNVHSIVQLSSAQDRENILEGTFQDVSARVAAERAQEELARELAEARRLETIGRLAGGIAHDFNNQLTVILGSCYALGEASPDDPDLEAIEKAAEHSAELTRQLLSYARRQVLDVKVVDANTIVAELRPVLQTLVPDNVELTLRQCPQQATLSGDATQIEQVVINLVANACQAMPHGGKVRVETAIDQVTANQPPVQGMETGSYASLEVQDSGEGMDAETMERIFDPFFTTKEVGEGTGLGLATVHGIVKQCGGHVSVHSSQGEGTTFKVFFPLADAKVQERVPSKRPDLKTLQGARILVVDDQKQVGHSLCRVLQRTGCKPVFAIGAQQALDICGENTDAFDLLISDVVMPKMSGPELAETLQAERPDLKVLFVSGYAASEDTKGSHFLSKPFHPDRLVEVVADILSPPV